MPNVTRSAAQRARDNLWAWLEWYKATHPDEIPTYGVLAKRLGITAGSLSQHLTPGTSKMPQFQTLVGARELTGLPLDHLLFHSPPKRTP